MNYHKNKNNLINKYIDEIEIKSEEKHKVSILNITFNKNEIENIGYMFRNDCFDMALNIDEKDIILSSIKSNDEIQEYIEMLRKFYNIKETTIQAELFDITQYGNDEIIQIIPQEKKNKFEKNKYTILQIGV